MQLVKLFSTTRKKLYDYNLTTPVYALTNGMFVSYTEVEDLGVLSDCVKAPSNDACLALTRQLTDYVGALVIDESCAKDISNKSSKVELHHISSSYNGRDIKELYSLLKDVWGNNPAQDSCHFLYRLMNGAITNDKLFIAYLQIIPPEVIHTYLLSLQKNVTFCYTYPFGNPVPRLHYARDLLTGDSISKDNLLNANRALHEAQQLYYPPVYALDYDSFPVHRTYSQSMYRRIADWLYMLYTIKDKDYRNKRYSSIACPSLVELIVFYLRSLYNDMAIDYKLPLILGLSEENSMKTRSLNNPDNKLMIRKYTKIFVCSRNKQELVSFMKKNRIAGDIQKKFIGICDCYFIDQFYFEKIKGTPLKDVEECMKKILNTHTGVYWTTYKEEP